MSTTKKTKLAHQAHYQIEAMCFALQNAARDKDRDALPHLVQALSIRIIELNGGLMNMVSGNDGDFQDLKTTVFGVFGLRAEVTQ